MRASYIVSMILLYVLSQCKVLCSHRYFETRSMLRQWQIRSTVY